MGVVLLGLSSGAEAATQKKKGPPPKPVPTDRALGFFGNTRDEMLGSIKRVGILPVRVPLEDRPDAAKAIQDAVARNLTLAHFEVVLPDTYQATYDKFNKQLGGMYDAKTGVLKDDVYNAVTQNALREFVSKERLDGYVVVRVVQESADYAGLDATWDGVRENVDGKKTDGFVSFWNATDTRGSVPALSIRVQIVSAQGRVTFGRQGGVQLTAYFGTVPEQGLTFVRVSHEDLLKDLPRIDRAVRVATLPLVRTPLEIRDGQNNPEINLALIKPKDLPALPVAKTGEPESPLKVQRDQILTSVKRVALSPVYAGDFDVPEDAKQRLLKLVPQELAPLHWEIIDSPKIREVLLNKLLSSQVFDPLTGKRDAARVTEIRKSVFKDLGTEPPDAILWLGVESFMALQREGDVEWDGVNQNAFTRGPVKKSWWVPSGTANPMAGQGSIKVSSFTAYMTDANDTVLYRSRGGIEVLQNLKLSYNDAQTADLAPSELFSDPFRETAAVRVALQDLVLTPEALYALKNPDPKKGKKK
jgi:hypothetical protein